MTVESEHFANASRSGQQIPSPLSFAVWFSPDRYNGCAAGVVMSTDATALTLLETRREGGDRVETQGKGAHRFVGVCSTPLLQFYRQDCFVSLQRGETYLFDNAALTCSLPASAEDNNRMMHHGGDTAAMQLNPSIWESVTLRFRSHAETDLFVEGLLQGQAEELLRPPSHDILAPSHLQRAFHERSRSSSSSAAAAASRRHHSHSRGGSASSSTQPGEGRAHRHRSRSSTTRGSSVGGSRRRRSAAPPAAIVSQWMRLLHHRHHMLQYVHKELVHQAYLAAVATTQVTATPTITLLRSKLREVEVLFDDVERERADLEKERREFEAERRRAGHPAKATAAAAAPRHRGAAADPLQVAAIEEESYIGHLPNERNAAHCSARLTVPGSEWATSFLPGCSEEVLKSAVADVCCAVKLPRGLVTVAASSLRASRDGLSMEATVKFNPEVTMRDAVERRLNACSFLLLRRLYADRAVYKAVNEQRCRPAGPGHQRRPVARSASLGDTSSRGHHRHHGTKEEHERGRHGSGKRRHTTGSSSCGSSSIGAALQSRDAAPPNRRTHHSHHRHGSTPSSPHQPYPGAAPSTVIVRPAGSLAHPAQQHQAASPRQASFPQLSALLAADEAVARSEMKLREARERIELRHALRFRAAKTQLSEAERRARREREGEEEVYRLLLHAEVAAPLQQVLQGTAAIVEQEARHRAAVESCEERARQQSLRLRGRAVLQEGVAAAKAALQRREAAERLDITTAALSGFLGHAAEEQRWRHDQAERAHESGRRAANQRLSIQQLLSDTQAEEAEGRMEIIAAEQRSRHAMQMTRLEVLHQLSTAHAAPAATTSNSPTTSLSRGSSSNQREDSTKRSALLVEVSDTTMLEDGATTGRRRRLEAANPTAKPFHYMTFCPEDMEFKHNAESVMEGVLGCSVNRNLEVVEIVRRLPKRAEEDEEFQAGDMLLDASGQSLHSLSHLREVISHRVTLIQEEARQEFADLPHEELTTNPALQKYIEVLCEHHNFLIQVLRGCDILQVVVKS